MPRRLCLKQFTPSDLTFFRRHWESRHAGNQKAINLNADVFVGSLYPGLPGLLTGARDRIPVALELYGPGVRQLLTLQRKIIKGGSYKNWRLDGEFVYDPVDDPNRFEKLEPGDLAVMEFFGDPWPHSVRMSLLSAAEAADKALIDRLSGVLGTQSMVVLTESDLNRAVSSAGVPPDHPISTFVSGPLVERAALGDPAAFTEVVSRARGKTRTTREQLDRSRENATKVGQLGEALVDFYLFGLKSDGRIAEYTWESEDNAINPFDFSINNLDGVAILMDVKSTGYSHEQPFHVSSAELEAMASRTERYDIYRLSDVTPDGASLRISRDLRSLASRILTVTAGLPDGVRLRGVIIDPDTLTWSEPVRVRHPTTPPADEPA